MDKLEKLYDYTEQQNIKICKEEQLDKFGKAALYCNINNKDMILTSASFEYKSTYDKAQIIAEEIGHYATSVGDTFKTEEDIATSKSEIKAIKYGLNLLVDEETLRHAILMSVTPKDVEYYTGLKVSTINEYLKYYALQNMYFYLDDNKALDLTKLPSWIVVEICNNAHL